MTILHVSDFHFNQRWFDWVLHRAPPHDLLVMSGDLLDLSGATSHSEQIGWVSDWIREYRRPLCVCSGNHDLQWDSANERWTPAYWLRALAEPNVWTDGSRVTLDGLSVLTIGCTTRPKGAEAEIWVVHVPPSHTRVAARVTGGDGGDLDLVMPVERYGPRLVLSGHVHDPVDWCEHRGRTLLLNPGRSDSAPFPNHILVRTERLTCQLVTAQLEELSTHPLAATAAVVSETSDVHPAAA